MICAAAFLDMRQQNVRNKDNADALWRITMGKRNVEILAPAGSFESMVAAVNAGADAVYIGGSRFGARAYANNLDEEAMIR